ncbi:MAG: TRAP transporter substrate-binding protein DctP [Gammaproteobacteria bacterium]|nr:TRAP transporter substrate-binding protein DctP [Gammaproteobacteria bacterium]MBU1653804.1 TRAP transporter substrate-binding protein DctP [Gammaproteobacteria bacterium]MBU1961716.1 TRAP transporter substrate-binding protein DctP [Gammaproteobacteria bacterium]
MKRILAVLSILCLAAPLPAGAVTLKLATMSPDGTNWMRAFRDAGKQIAKETQGRVKIRYYPGGVMGDDKSMLRKIRIGQLHGGALSAGGLASIHPDTQIYALPFVFRNYDEVEAARKEFDPIVLGKIKEGGFVSFGLVGGGFAYMMSNKRITTLDEARGHKIWVPEGDRISRISLESLGIAPVPLPITDVLTGIQTGLIDTLSAPPTVTIALQWHTGVKHLTNLPLLYIYGSLVISEKVFGEISPEDQAVMQRVLTKTQTKLDAAGRTDDQSALEALRKQGITFDDTNPREAALWRQKVTQAMDGLSGEGAMSPELMQRLRAYLGKVRGGG